MKKIYIILLKNSYLLFTTKKPKKKGNYTNEVRLFRTDEKTTSEDICKWCESNYEIDCIKEVKDWE